jgi:single-stranded-DNA-specific exonuclease
LNKKWEVKISDDELTNKIANEFNISKLVARILANKGLKESNEIEVFLNPRRSDFHDPFLMPDMKIAVDRILKAIETKEKVAIYGDYDADGITSSTVLKRFLSERGLDADIYIPNRLNEGYGLNEKAIKEIAQTNHTLIITVDCGITGNKEIELAKTLKIDTVVTDHHEPTEELPKALAVVDCKRKDNKYPFSELAGVGVAFKLIQAISIKLGIREEEYLKYLDLVCVGTISDIVPLKDENRTISKLGLRLVKQTKNIGLKVLLNSMGYQKIDSNTISFGVAPRINACGRMGHEKEALELFLTNSVQEAEKITQRLNEYNLERQQIEKRIFDEVEEIIQKSEEKNLPCIVLEKENWHHGVIGIVSSKITDMYFKPSILMSIEGDIAKGSGRSIPGFDLHEALENCKEEIEQFGGHSMAVGVTVKKANFDKFKNKFEEYAREKDISKITPILNIDEKITLKDITIKDIRDLELLEPFGEGNKPPIFQINNVKIDSIRSLSQGKHLKMEIKDQNSSIQAIGFNLGNLANDYKIEDKINIAGTLEINNYNGRENIQINIRDVMKSL